MTDKKTIIIRNVYYMLAYAFQVLKQTNYKKIETEPFENVQDLFASIIHIGVSQQLKRGLHKEYILKDEDLKILRGKLDLTNTIKLRTKNNIQTLNCEHDELSVDNVFNQIIKTTLLNLTKEKSVKRETRLKLRSILRFFSEVSDINLSDVKWSQLRFQRNNKSYEMLLNICYFVYTESIMSHNSGDKKVMAFSDDNMAKVYEKFILEYYKQHHRKLSANAAEIKWNLDEDFADPVIKFLPKMQSDIMLRYNGLTLIIDAKYYSKNMQQQFDKNTLINGNLYQIYTYVKNEDKTNSGKVAGMLLYAKTDSDIVPSADFSTGGNRISVKTLNLDANFGEIKRQLDKIADDYFYKDTIKQVATI